MAGQDQQPDDRTVVVGGIAGFPDEPEFVIIENAIALLLSLEFRDAQHRIGVDVALAHRPGEEFGQRRVGPIGRHHPVFL
jgi:hypothetical protein